MAVPPSFVSQITYFDLDTLSHEEFMQELVLAHALLQRAASRDGDDDELIHFHDMQWWYSVSLTPANSSSTPPNWSTLVEESEYREMLQRVTSYYDPTELTVELTNVCLYCFPSIKDCPVTDYDYDRILLSQV